MIEILTLPVLGVALIAIAVTFALSMGAKFSFDRAQETVSMVERQDETKKGNSYTKGAAIFAAIAFCSLIIGGYMVQAIIKG